jgi:magnesium-transporting ATPase (P-type)/uncharacterized membrane protein (DUF373 family)
MAESRMTNENEKEQPEVAWHAMTGDQALYELYSSPQGLDDEEVDKRLREFGPNKLREAKTRPWWKRLLEQFSNLLILVLIAAGVVTLFLGHLVDAAAIFGVVVINGLIGFIQEGKAEKALESIKDMLSPEAMVIRNGRKGSIPAEELVPGDIVIIEAGDRIPADIRLLQARQLRTQEAPLTGESEAVDKNDEPVAEDAELAERTSIAHAGTIVAEGKGDGVVVRTGRYTEVGRISEMLEEVEEVQSPLLRKLDHFARVLTIVILIAAAAVFALGWTLGDQPASEMFLVAVAIAVAAIPEGLPAIVSITLALGVQSMARRNAIIRRLPAVETLGSVTTIFTDKTGTLTQNEMTAQAIALPDGEVKISGVGFAPDGTLTRNDKKVDPEADILLRRFLIAGVLCNDSEMAKDEHGRWGIHGAPTEGAFVVAAAKAGWDAHKLRNRFRRLDAIPFDSARRYMATLDEDADRGMAVEHGGDRPVIHIKGAPEVILARCTTVAGLHGAEDFDADAWSNKVADLSSRGYRVLALAQRPADGDQLHEADVDSDLQLLGLIGLLDPPRKAAIEAVRRCLKAGIRVKMVTGDHKLTALAIADQIGLKQTDEAMTGRALGNVSDEEMAGVVQRIDVFARAAPEHKLRLVRASQAAREVCAMTGDGVNDAPALKQADVGVAMGIEGTEAAKDAASVVLADDNFASIANAVEEGRKVYDNIRKTITFIVPTNGGQAMVILAAMALGGTQLPVTPVQILWVNMVTAVTLGLALAFEPAESDIMDRPPRPTGEPILSRFLLWRVAFVSVLLMIAVFGVFTWQMQAGADIQVARTMAVNMLVAGQLFYVFNSRYLLASSLSVRGIIGSRAVLIAVALVIALQLAWTYAPWLQLLFGSTPLEPWQWAIPLGIGVVIFLLVEIEKALFRWRNGRRQRAAEAEGEEGAMVPAGEPALAGQSTAPRHGLLYRGFHAFEKTLAAILLVMIAGVAVVAVVELGFLLYRELVSPSGPGLLVDANGLFEVFGMFLIVLIAIELMVGVYRYVMDRSIHVELVVLVAITALTREVVLMEPGSTTGDALYLLGLAALLAALLGGYYLVKRLDTRASARSPR